MNNSVFVGGPPMNNSVFVGGPPMNNSLFVGGPPMNNSVFVGGPPTNNSLFVGGSLTNDSLFVGGPPTNNYFSTDWKRLVAFAYQVPLSFSYSSLLLLALTYRLLTMKITSHSKYSSNAR